MLWICDILFEIKVLDPIGGIWSKSLGTNAALDVALIALKSSEDKNKNDLALVRLFLDAQNTAGHDLVKMMENLGRVIDMYI